MVHDLYRHYDSANRLLYVGISLSAIMRLRQHRKKQSPWFRQIVRVQIERYPSKGAALKAERIAIRTERPLYNIVRIYEPPKPNPPKIPKPPIVGLRKSGLRAISSPHLGRPFKGTESTTAKALQPWKAAGLSRRTWYRRNRSKKASAPGLTSSI